MDATVDRFRDTSIVNRDSLAGDGRTSELPTGLREVPGAAAAGGRLAAWMLILCSFLWATSFPSVRALSLLQTSILPEGSTWFFTSLGVTLRFGLSALALAILAGPRLRGMTRSEIHHGVGFGLFGAGGILLQMDGLAHTSASTSAFLTQCYCIFLPLLVTLRDRRWPSPAVLVSCVMVFAGVVVLADVDLRGMKMGRGEAETILATLFFSGQILWLERPSYVEADVVRFSLVSFAVMGIAPLPLVFSTAPGIEAPLRAYSSWAAAGFMGILVVICTLGGYMLMTRWQKHVPSTRAGLIYCMEPVFASLLALVLPGLFSRWAGIEYPDEDITWHLLVGGGLIIAANVLILLVPARRRGPRREAARDGETLPAAAAGAPID